MVLPVLLMGKANYALISLPRTGLLACQQGTLLGRVLVGGDGVRASVTSSVTVDDQMDLSALGDWAEVWRGERSLHLPGRGTPARSYTCRMGLRPEGAGASTGATVRSAIGSVISACDSQISMFFGWLDRPVCCLRACWPAPRGSRR